MSKISGKGSSLNFLTITSRINNAGYPPFVSIIQKDTGISSLISSPRKISASANILHPKQPANFSVLSSIVYDVNNIEKTKIESDLNVGIKEIPLFKNPEKF